MKKIPGKGRKIFQSVDRLNHCLGNFSISQPGLIFLSLLSSSGKMSPDWEIRKITMLKFKLLISASPSPLPSQSSFFKTENFNVGNLGHIPSRFPQNSLPENSEEKFQLCRNILKIKNFLFLIFKMFLHNWNFSSEFSEFI